MNGGVDLVFFDVETTVPSSSGQRFWVIEFGAIRVCPRKLLEVESYCTLVKPDDLASVETKRYSGITRADVSSAPTFTEVADRIFNILNGRIWVGHNIQRFDCHRIRESFAGIGKTPPQPVAVIDSLTLIARGFGQRAGNLKMATLASYFGLGQQKHRSLDDVRMNLEIIKHCAAVLLLESMVPDFKNETTSAMVTRSRSGCKLGGNTIIRKLSTPARTTRRQTLLLPYSRSSGLNKVLINKQQQGPSLSVLNARPLGALFIR